MNAKNLKKRSILTREEEKLEDQIEAGEWTGTSGRIKRQVSSGVREKKNRVARVNIRLTAETLELIQKRAEEEGIGYQTLMGSILHKYARGLFVGTEDLKKIVLSMGSKKIRQK